MAQGKPQSLGVSAWEARAKLRRAAMIGVHAYSEAKISPSPGGVFVLAIAKEQPGE